MDAGWGAVMVAVGLFMVISATRKSQSVIYRLLVARSQGMWGEHVHRFLQLVGLAIIASGLVFVANRAMGQPPGKAQLQMPRQPPINPGGILGPSGTYHTISGVLYAGGGKVESNTLVVDRVDGGQLKQPLYVVVRHVSLPPKVRCTLKGYELGEMIGRPPAEYAAYEELGGDPEELMRRDATVWRWRPYFVPLIVVEPQGLEVSTRWGLGN